MSRGKSADNKRKGARVAGDLSPGFARNLGENTGRVLRPFIPLVLMLLVGTGLSALLWRSMANAAGPGVNANADDRLTVLAIRNSVLQKQRPSWILREDFEQVANLGLFAESRSIFEANLSRQIAIKYESSPWVERVQAVRLRYPAQIELEIDWRKPVARVERSNMVLDRQGVLLNLSADRPDIRDGTPLIAGVVPSRVEPGIRVREKELIEAIDLLAVVREALNSSPGQLKVMSLQRESSGRWLVLTDRGPVIYWGWFTEDPPIDEPRTRDKADLLRRRLCESKDPGVLEYVKVYTTQAPIKLRKN